ETESVAWHSLRCLCCLLLSWREEEAKKERRGSSPRLLLSETADRRAGSGESIFWFGPGRRFPLGRRRDLIRFAQPPSQVNQSAARTTKGKVGQVRQGRRGKRAITNRTARVNHRYLSPTQWTLFPWTLPIFPLSPHRS